MGRWSRATDCAGVQHILILAKPMHTVDSSFNPESGEMHMNRLLAALIAAAFVSLAGAQTVAPSTTTTSKQRAAQSVTGLTAENSGNTQATAAEQAKNVKASKETAKLSKDEKARLAKDATRLNVNPENSSGAAATATMQRQTTAESKATPKQNAELKSKEGKQQLAKDLQKKSTP
jgi:hypothetical protein